MFSIIKPADATRLYRIEFARALEEVWRGGAEYSAGEYVRPPIPNGYEYECTNGGQTSQADVKWPTTIGAEVVDGSVVWTCRDFGANATDSLSTRSVIADAGLTVDSSAIDGTTVQFTLSGGTENKSYDVSVEAVTAAGDTFDERVRVSVIA